MLLEGAYCVGEHFVALQGTQTVGNIEFYVPKITFWSSHFESGAYLVYTLG